MKSFFQSILHLFYTKKGSEYREIPDEEYLRSFGVATEKNPKPDKEKLRAAYDRAWANRDFEIDKFWTRAAYFWGFIVLIFTAYFSLLSNDKIEKQDSQFFQLCLICLGLIFSIAWVFVIKGSKHWQENWEKHIDKLEDHVSGPLYKTIYHKGTFYSVSKINLTLSVVVAILWVFLFLHFLLSNYCLIKNSIPCRPFDLLDISIIITASLSIASIVWGYSRKSFLNEKDKFIGRKP